LHIIGGDRQVHAEGRLPGDTAANRLDVLAAVMADDAVVGAELRVALVGEVGGRNVACKRWRAAPVHLAREVEHSLIADALLERARGHQREILSERQIETRANVGAIVAAYRPLDVAG